MNKTKWLVSIGVIVVLVIGMILVNKPEILQGKSKEEKENEVIQAIHQNDTKKLTELIAEEYPINFISSEGYTPLETALNDRAYDATILLLEKKAELNPDTSSGVFLEIVITLGRYQGLADEPLYQTELKMYKEMIKVASKNKANDINAKNDRGNTALHLAALTGHPDIIKELIELGSDTAAQNIDKETPLLIAVKEGNLEAVKLFYPFHNETLDKDTEENNLFYSAAMSGRNEIIGFLLENNTAGLDERNMEGKTALMIAAEYGYTEIVEVLLQHGADRALSSNEGLTALDYAAHWKHEAIIKLLESR